MVLLLGLLHSAMYLLSFFIHFILDHPQKLKLVLGVFEDVRINLHLQLFYYSVLLAYLYF